MAKPKLQAVPMPPTPAVFIAKSGDCKSCGAHLDPINHASPCKGAWDGSCWVCGAAPTKVKLAK